MRSTFSFSTKRLVSSVVAVGGAAILVAGCSSAGTPSAAPTSSAEPTTSAAPTSSGTSSAGSTAVAPTTSAPASATTTTPGPTVVPTTIITTATAETTTGATGTDLAGEVYGRIVAVDPASSEITLDKYDWFTGAAAEQACNEDGVTERDNGWCSVYYYRNRNPMLRVVAVSPDATVVTLSGGSPTQVPSDLAGVQERIAGTESSDLFQITVTDGQVTSITELYFP